MKKSEGICDANFLVLSSDIYSRWIYWDSFDVIACRVKEFGKRMRGAKQHAIYAAYRGEDNIGEGTIGELAEKLDMTVKNLYWYSSPARMRRYEKLKKKNRSLVLVRIE